jgi:predicted ATPase
VFDLEEAYSRCLQELRARLKITIDPEGLGILADHIPSLRLVVDIALPLTTTAVNEAMMAYLLRKLLEVLSSKRTPILFFFDDLQWADPLSLALLTALVKGSGPDLLQLSSANISKQSGSEGVQQEDDKLYIMFVGSYRDNEVHENHPLAKVLYKFQSDTAINMTTISLSGFSIETLNEMLSEFLCMPVRRVRSLSELIIHKTDGQPLHVNVFIQALTADSLLTHSFTRGWEWDADSIDIFPITDSVAELYTFKLRRLPIDTLLGLQILSCFGSHTEQRVLRLVANYDGERSVDINAAIHVAISIGLVEQAAHFVRFTHDMIQKATIESICHEDLVPLLRKLIGSILNNSSSTGELGSVLFVVVDLVNRIGSDAKSSEQERVTFANLNLQAGLKAIAAPDFAGAAKYAEKGIAFLSDTCWETQYDLSLGLYETAVLSHFSNLTGDRDKLMKRMDAVFEFAKDFSDKFNTHCVWIKTLAMTDLSRAIEEGLNALERLGEPLDLSNIDYNAVRDELVKRKAQFSGERRKNFLSTNHLIDCNKVRAMKIMTSLLGYYIQTKPIHAAFVCCRMIEMSMNHGHCEDSVHAAAGFAGALVNTLGDIDEGSAWGHTTLSLMNMYNKQILIPSIHAMIYGIVFQWTGEELPCIHLFAFWGDIHACIQLFVSLPILKSRSNQLWSHWPKEFAYRSRLEMSSVPCRIPFFTWYGASNVGKTLEC